jgi:ABC-type uncharacterized transport system substrate-binding protein
MLRTGILLFAAMAFVGCSTQYTAPDPVVDSRPGDIFEPPIAEITTTSLDRIPFPPQLPAVAIVLTNDQPAYADVARELTQHFRKYQIYNLGDAGQVPISVLRVINDSNSGAIVAIGLRAARSSVAMGEKPVVFSQVFNYQEHDLLQEHSRGVAALAPLDAQLAAWKEIDPTVSRIGAIVGEGHDDLVAAAQLAAERYGIELRVQVTRSDQETLYVFRRMIRDIDGFWLFPDNRVLSARVLQQMLEDAGRQQVSVTVPSESMLQLGAMISMSTVASDIAATIVKVVRQIQAGGLAQVPPITQLSEIRIRTNDTTQVVER